MLSSDGSCCKKISFEKTGFFSKLMLDYLNESEKMKPFYGNFPNFEGFQKQIEQKKSSFSLSSRQVLSQVLLSQYQNLDVSAETIANIEILKKENTFTITTGHQLNLYTGPLYFLYKIISTINLCEELSQKFPNSNFVPVYWMATEDHDFEEINFFNFKGKKIQWNSNQSGAVGRFSTNGLEEICNVFERELNGSVSAKQLLGWFKKGYLEYQTLADATRYIVNALFSKYGLVILDADDSQLKKQFIPFCKKELLEQTSYHQVSNTVSQLKERGYKVQVNPRKVNLFYLKDSLRERIVYQEDGSYKINNSSISFSSDEIIDELYHHPIRFSPNVVLRPLYQEIILPNLCYIGGGGELGYWMELKECFKAFSIPFPILLLRNSVQLVSKKQNKKLSNLNISLEELFLKQNTLIAEKILEKSKGGLDFQQQKLFLKKQFLALHEVAKRTDKSFTGAVNAQERKQIKGLDNLEKKWLRAEKRNQKELVNRIVRIQNELLPNGSLEERQRNFSEFYEQHGEEFICMLKKNLNPLELKFYILTV